MTARIQTDELTRIAQACIDAKREADQWTAVYEECVAELRRVWDGETSLGPLTGGVVRWRKAHVRAMLDQTKARQLLADAGIPSPEKEHKIGAGPIVETQK